MPAAHPLRVPALGLAGIALLAALLLALFDWATALVLIASLLVGWAIVLAFAIGGTLYRRHRTRVLASAAVVVALLLVVLRPDGAGEEESGEPMPVSGYAAELWPNRIAGPGSFILRERVDIGGGDASDGRANVQPVATGPWMHELRFVPGTGVGMPTLRLAEGGEATIVVNPLEDGRVHHARGGDVSRLELPMGPVVRVRLHELPAEARVAYLVGPGRSLAAVASAVTPLRRMPRIVAVLLFVLIGALAAHVAFDRLIGPLHRRATEKPQPPATPGPGRPGAPIERAPLIPRRK